MDNRTLYENLNVGVFGLWHLGCVTAACVADVGFSTIGFDPDEATVENLSRFQSPVFEPGLDSLIRSCVESENLKFTSNLAEIKDCDLLWVTFDTPVDEKDQADVESVLMQIKNVIPLLKKGCIVLVSSQLPVGSMSRLENEMKVELRNKQIQLAYSPENLRLGNAIDVFRNADRFVVGVQNQNTKSKLEPFFAQFSDNIIWMSIESAEMTKHAINSFLATSVAFINEISHICEDVGADAKQVEEGLKSDIRIGQKAYLSPGTAFSGGTLARDLRFLSQNGKELNIKTHLIDGVLSSNESHSHWVTNKFVRLKKDLKKHKVGILGLTYKPGTNTLRRSAGLALAKWLVDQGAHVLGFDPLVLEFPSSQKNYGVQLVPSCLDLVRNSDIVYVSTQCPEFLAINVAEFSSKLVIDPTRHLYNLLEKNSATQYYTIGKG